MDLIGNMLRAVADSIDPPAPAPKAPPAPPAAPDSPRASAEAAAAKLGKLLSRLETWRRINSEAAADLDALVCEYNAALEDAKELAKAFPGESFDSLHVNKPSTKHGIDPALLPQHVRELPKVLVLSVDVGVVNALVKCGQVDEKDVAPARTETVGSASVRGPKPLVVKP